MSSFKQSALVLSHKDSPVMPSISGDTSIVSRNGVLYTYFNGVETALSSDFFSDTFFYASSSSGQVVDNFTETDLLYNVEVQDFSNSYNPLTGQYIVPSTGYYFFQAGIVINIAADIRHAGNLSMRRNGSSYIDRWEFIPDYTTSYLSIDIGGVMYQQLNAGDVIKCVGYLNDYGFGTTPSVAATSENKFFGWRVA